MQAAEKYYIEADDVREAITMYTSAGQIEEAHRVCSVLLLDDCICTVHTKQLTRLGALSIKCTTLWRVAVQLATKYMKAEELNRMYRKQAEALEAEGKLKEAERLYLMINEAELAINMYKKNKMYADVVRLVRTHKPDELEATNLAFARVRISSIQSINQSINQ